MTSETQIRIGRRTAIAVSYFLLVYPMLAIIFEREYHDYFYLFSQLIILYLVILPIFLFFRAFAYGIEQRLVKTTLFLILVHVFACVLMFDYDAVGLIVQGLDYDTIYSVIHWNYHVFFYLVLVPLVLQGFLGIRKEKRHLRDLCSNSDEGEGAESGTSNFAILSLRLSFLGWLLHYALYCPSSLLTGAILGTIAIGGSLLIWSLSVCLGLMGLSVVRKRKQVVPGSKMAIFGISLSLFGIAVFIMNIIVIRIKLSHTY